MTVDYTARERAAIGAASGICRALSDDHAYMCDLDAGHEGDHHGFELPTITLDEPWCAAETTHPTSPSAQCRGEGRGTNSEGNER